MEKILGCHIEQIKKNIFLFKFDKQYDLAMTFLRVNEFYESPKYKDKIFDIFEYMEWYSRKYGKGTFTYTKDWEGFNIPGKTIMECYNTLPNSMKTKYDNFMIKLVNYINIKHDVNYNDMYIIGVYGSKYKNTLNHEISHGIYYTDNKYKNKANKLIKNLPLKIRKNLCCSLEKMGYNKNVFNDEIQAYMSTGLTKNFDKKLLKKYKLPFIKLFKKNK